VSAWRAGEHEEAGVERQQSFTVENPDLIVGFEHKLADSVAGSAT